MPCGSKSKIDLDLVCSGGAGYAECERRDPGQVAAYSTVRFRVPRRTRGTPCAAVGRCARACGPGLLDSNIPSRVAASAACWGSSGLGAPVSAEGTSLEDMRAAGSPGARRGTAPAPENQEGYASRLGSHVGIACNARKSRTSQANPIFH